MHRCVLAAALLILASHDASAWGLTGHRVTAAIAEKYLTLESRAAIRDILGPSETLAEAASWPDFMRSSDDPFRKTKSPPFHFVTVPKGKKYSEVGAPTEGDAITGLQRFSEVLKNPASSLNNGARRCGSPFTSLAICTSRFTTVMVRTAAAMT